MPALRFLLPSLAGLAFFVLPVRAEGSLTVPFDVAVRWLVHAAPSGVALYALGATLFGAGASLVARSGPRFASFRTSWPTAIARGFGAILALVYWSGMGPELLLSQSVAGLMWETLALSIAVIVPMGGALVGLLIHYGAIEFIGTLLPPLMRPLFHLPGRASLDSLTSWVGSYSVGLYLTRRMTQEGYYHRREAYTIATCFSTVSIGFVAVVARTLNLLHLFPVIFAVYFVAVYALTALLVRIPPISRVPDTYLVQAIPETSGPAGLVTEAWRAAVARAAKAPPLGPVLWVGLKDGLGLAAAILGSVLAVGTAALLLANETPIFQWLGRPLVPLLGGLGFREAALIAPACVAGIAEMYIPALLAREAPLPERFFIAVLSVSQLIFFSSLAPMILDMFRELPVRARDLVWLFCLRTALLIPCLGLLTQALVAAGVLA